MTSTPVSDSPLSARLWDWALSELDYTPPMGSSSASSSFSSSNHEAWQEICVGSLSQQWHYLLKHVRSKAHVHHIRGNLILEHHRQKLKASRHADQSILPNIESTIASGFNPDIEDERAQLLAEYKDLTRRIQKSTLRMTQNETRIRQYRRDVRWQTDLRRNTEIELNERRLAAQLLHRFATQGRKEVTRLSSWAKDLRDLESDESGSTIFRSLKQEEKLFAHEGMDIKTSAQHAVKESGRLAINLLESLMKDPQSVDNFQKEQFQRELGGQLFHRLGALEIQNAFLQEIDEQIAELSKLGLASNIHEDYRAYWTDLETSGQLAANTTLNPSGKFKSMKQMLVDFAQKHVQSRSNAENTKGKIKANETEIAQTLEQLRTAFMAIRSKVGPSDWERDNFMRWVELELVFQSGSALLGSLKETIKSAQDRHQSVNEVLDQFTQTWTQHSKDLSKMISHKLSTLEMVIAVNKSFFKERLHPTVLEIEEIIQKDILQNTEWKVMNGLKDKLSQQLKQYLALPSIKSLQTTAMVRKTGSQRFQTASMSIHRLKRDLPCPESGSNPDPSRFLSSLLSHLDGNCSMSTLSLLDRARDLKWKLEDLQRWITHMSQQEHETVKKRLKAMFELIKQLELHEKRQKEALEPVLSHELARLESGIKRNKNIKKRIDIWQAEPAQTAIAQDPNFQVADLTLQAWQDQYRVSLTRWHQINTDRS